MKIMSELKVDVTDLPGSTPVKFLQLHGRINLSNYEQLENLGGEIYQDGARYILIDLSGVPSISSVGLRAMLSIYKLFESSAASSQGETSPDQKGELETKSAHFKLIIPVEQVCKVFRTAGFEAYIEIFDNLPDAQASFTQ